VLGQFLPSVIVVGELVEQDTADGKAETDIRPLTESAWLNPVRPIMINRRA